MSERYTQRFAGIYDNKESRYIDIPNVSAVLNDRDRLAAEVATLRELLRETRYFVHTATITYLELNDKGVDKAVALLPRVDAALATSGETP